MKQEIDVIGIQMDLGASKRGVNMGPSAIRHAGLLGEIAALEFPVQDKGDIIPRMPKGADANVKMKNFDEIFEANKRLYDEVMQSYGRGALPVVLGGDHCVASASISAASKSLGKVGVIWIDAHGDFNDDKSSPSGNMHGMPFSAVCGLGPKEMVDFESGICPVSPKNAVLVGARDLDSQERRRLAAAGVNVFTMNSVDKLGMAEVMHRAIALACDGTEGVYVSFDADAITPEAVPGVGTPVHSGLTLREAFLAAEMLAESGKIRGIDMVEVNPMLDTYNKTGQVACQLILSMLGKSLF